MPLLPSMMTGYPGGIQSHEVDRVLTLVFEIGKQNEIPQGKVTAAHGDNAGIKGIVIRVPGNNLDFGIYPAFYPDLPGTVIGGTGSLVHGTFHIFQVCHFCWF